MTPLLTSSPAPTRQAWPGVRRSWAGRALRVAAVPVLLVLLWSAVAAVADSTAVATPTQTLNALAHGITDGEMLEAFGQTLWVAMVSFALSAAIGLLLGVVLALSRFWGDVFEGPIYWIYSIPKITLYPIFLLLFGLTVSARVSFAVFHGFIPLVVYVFTAIRATPPVYLKTAAVYGMGKWDTFRTIALPDSLPAVIVGLRYCFSLTFLGVVVAEMFASTEGSGQLLVLTMRLHRVDQTFAIALTLVVIALLINSLFRLLETRVTKIRTA